MISLDNRKHEEELINDEQFDEEQEDNLFYLADVPHVKSINSMRAENIMRSHLNSSDMQR